MSSFLILSYIWSSFLHSEVLKDRVLHTHKAKVGNHRATFFVRVDRCVVQSECYAVPYLLRGR